MALISVDLFTLDHYDSYTWRKEALFQLALENSHPNPCSGCVTQGIPQQDGGWEGLYDINMMGHEYKHL